MGEGENSPSSGSFGWLNQINDDKKKSNLILCAQEPYIHERVTDPPHMWEVQRQEKWVYKTVWASGEVGYIVPSGYYRENTCQWSVVCPSI